MTDLRFKAMETLYKNGYTVTEMAEIFGLSFYVVSTHLNLYLGVENERTKITD